MLQVFVTWIHIIAAMFWIGGTLFFALVLIPTLAGALPDKQKIDLISKVGKRFRVCGWFSLGVLVLTGAIRLYQNDMPLGSYGASLIFKLTLVVLVIVLTLVHDFILGPKSIALSRQKRGPHPFQAVVRWVARLNLILGLLVVLAAVFFVRGY